MRHPVMLIVLAAASLPSVAYADEKAACVAAYERSQNLRRESKLREAREQLAVCTQEACPKLVRTDCVQWMDEVTASIPTLIFGAHDAKGRDRTDVRVTLDGEVIQGQLGQEVSVDPGPHVVRFDTGGRAPVEQQIVVRAGEKARLVTISYDAPSAPAPAGAGEARREEPPSRSRPLPILPLVLGGLGAGAVGVGSFLAITAGSELHDLRGTCAPHCEPSDVDKVNLRYRVAAGAIGVGAVAIGVAVWLFVTRPRSQDRHSAPVGLTWLLPAAL